MKRAAKRGWNRIFQLSTPHFKRGLVFFSQLLKRCNYFFQRQRQTIRKLNHGQMARGWVGIIG